MVLEGASVLATEREWIGEPPLRVLACCCWPWRFQSLVWLTVAFAAVFLLAVGYLSTTTEVGFDKSFSCVRHAQSAANVKSFVPRDGLDAIAVTMSRLAPVPPL